MAGRDKRITIGLLVEDIFEDYTKEVVKNVSDAIPNDGSMRLIVLAGKHGGGGADTNVGNYCRVYNSVYSVDALCGFDGLLVSMGSLNRDRLYEEGPLKGCRDIPTVFIADDVPGRVAVKYDCEPGIREAVDYLVNLDGFTCLCMLGGRDGNADAMERKEVFGRCVRESGLIFPEHAYVGTNMSEHCAAEAARLLDQNPEAEAIFCVNDAVAAGLYEVMRERGLTPGRDIKVFGFDNTRMSGEMNPPLASIGPSGQTTGQKALELLLAQLDGERAESAKVPSKLYVRKSFDYGMYDYVAVDMLRSDDALIYRMFDDCFYRYKNERYDRERVDLKRLFYEFISGILRAIRNRYMSDEEFEELAEMADTFIGSGAMAYTDTRKFMDSIAMLQRNINESQDSLSVNIKINRLFLRMKDELIFSLAEQRERSARRVARGRDSLQQLLVIGSDYCDAGDSRLDKLTGSLGKLGVRNAALFLFDAPAHFRTGGLDEYPEHIRLRCVLKDAESYPIPPERQDGRLRDVFSRPELHAKCKAYLALPIFYERDIYGLFACELSDSVCERGEFVADQLGRAFRLDEARGRAAEGGSEP